MQPFTEDELEERAVALRVTLEEVEKSVLFQHFFTAGQAVRSVNLKTNTPLEGQMEPLERLTICIMTLRNGFTVMGKSACASAANYQKDIGERIARQDALNKVWELLGFRLLDKIQAGVF